MDYDDLSNPVMDIFDDPQYRDAVIRDLVNEPSYDATEDLTEVLSDF